MKEYLWITVIFATDLKKKKDFVYHSCLIIESSINDHLDGKEQLIHQQFKNIEIHQLLTSLSQGERKDTVIMIHIPGESSHFMNSRKMQTLMEFAADCTAMGHRKSVRKKSQHLRQLNFYESLLRFTAILTNFSGHN